MAFIYYIMLGGILSGLSGWLGVTRLATIRPERGRRCFLVITCTLAGMLSGFLLQGQEDLLNVFRILAGVSILSGASVCDCMEKRIPNLYPVAAFGLSVALMIVRIAIEKKAGAEILVGTLLGGMVPFMFLILFRRLSRLILHQNGIGWGDIKLLTALGCLLGVIGVVEILFFGQIEATVTALVLLILKKIGIKDGIPLAPFLLAGFLTAQAISI